MKISRALLDQIHRHLESGYPNEACGVMLGKEGVITEIVSADNQRTDSASNRYLINPLLYMRIEREADKRHLDVIGIYHSHPDVKGKAVESNSWRLRDDRSAFDQEPVEISG